MVHVPGEAVQLGGPLEVARLALLRLDKIDFQLLQLLLHILAEVLEVFGHVQLEDAFEGGLYPLLDLPELLLVFESGKAEFGLLLLALLPDLLLRAPKFPAKLIALFLFGVVLLVLFGVLWLFLLEEGEDVGGRFDSEVEVLEGVDFDVLEGE